jgi:Bacteroidetes VLRF1 release factor/Ankyrin repeats (many copies)
MLATLLKKQANISTTGYQEDAQSRKKERGTGRQPLIWFSSPLLPPNSSLGIYRAIFTNVEQEEENDIVSTIRSKQYAPISIPKSSKGSRPENPPTEKSPHFFLCMIGGGHFAAMVVSLSPKSGGKNAAGVEERQARVLAHKTFHRYTTRRKQGGSQSASDAAKGAAHSAGSTLRRYNEVALTNEIRALLAEWRPMIDSAELLFVRANGNTNRRTLYGPYDGQVLRYNDPRIRGFPFNTRRATQGELMRAFVELTRAKVSHIDEATLAAVAAKTDQAAVSKPEKSSSSSSATNKASKEEEAAISHTTQLQSLIRRSKAPAVLSYLSSNSLAPEFAFQPSSAQHNHHAPTPLHFAASTNAPTVVLALLTKMTADPTILNGEGKTSFELAGDRATRDAFRVARAELGEEAWDWDKARIPAPLTKREADKREEKERKDAEKKEADRRRAEMERLRDEQAAAAKQKEQQGSSSRKGGRSLGLGAEKTGAEKREEEARGMTPEMRMRLERERRARAAEERIRKMRGGGEASG